MSEWAREYGEESGLMEVETICIQGAGTGVEKESRGVRRGKSRESEARRRGELSTYVSHPKGPKDPKDHVGLCLAPESSMRIPDS